MKLLRTCKNLKGKRVLLRTDFNISLGTKGVINQDEVMRIDESLETINYLKKQKARIIIVSHIGRDTKDSLAPVAEYLSKKIKLTFLKGNIQDFVHTHIEAMKPGDVLMLENLRQDSGETTNSSSFARGLSRLADIYVNDAFAVSHRRHASIVGVSKFLPSYAGFLLEREVRELSQVLKKPKRPFFVIFGGAKFETKLPLIKKYIKLADAIVVGGALQNNFFKALGLEIGTSLSDEKKYNVGALLKTKKIILPEDIVVKRGSKTRIVDTHDVLPDEKIVDIGPKTVEMIEAMIQKSKTVLWNGPLGLYEAGFSTSTEHVLKTLAKSSAKSIVGGGDTVVTIKKLKLQKKLSFVSTGGGAMLEFLEKGKLPGIDALT